MGDTQMTNTIDLTIPRNAPIRARRRVLNTLLGELLSHRSTIDQTIESIEHLLDAHKHRAPKTTPGRCADLDVPDGEDRSSSLHAAGRTAAGNDISGI
jgi:hypothetical protein